MSGDLVYFQINVGDGEKAKAFYSGLFSWEIEPGNVEGGFQFGGPTPPGGGFGGGETAARACGLDLRDHAEGGLALLRELDRLLVLRRGEAFAQAT